MGSAAAAAAAQEEQVAGPNPPITYILPDEGWAPLLEIIVQDAPPGAVIEVNTGGMQALAERMLAEVGCPRRGRIDPGTPKRVDLPLIRTYPRVA